MWVRGSVGVVLCLVGALFVGQGLGAVHGSMMTGHWGYAVLGGVLIVIGVAVIVKALRLRRDAAARTPGEA
jgi:hypothetical protein